MKKLPKHQIGTMEIRPWHHPKTGRCMYVTVERLEKRARTPGYRSAESWRLLAKIVVTPARSRAVAIKIAARILADPEHPGRFSPVVNPVDPLVSFAVGWLASHGHKPMRDPSVKGKSNALLYCEACKQEFPVQVGMTFPGRGNLWRKECPRAVKRAR